MARIEIELLKKLLYTRKGINNVLYNLARAYYRRSETIPYVEKDIGRLTNAINYRDGGH